MRAEKIIHLLQPLDDFVYASFAPSPSAPSHLAFWRVFTHVGDFKSIIAIAWLIALWIVIRRGRALFASWFFGGCLLGQVGSYLLKLGVARPRPFPYEATPFLGYSFPSGHATGSWTLALLLCVVWNETLRDRISKRVLQGTGLVLAAGIGWSRLALGVHWFSDVYGGIVFSLGWAWIWKRFFASTSLFSLNAGDLPHKYIKEDKNN